MKERHGPRTFDGRSDLDLSIGRAVAAILKNQHTGGAFVASPDFAQYRYCWLRDGSFIAYAMDRAGEVAAADAFHAWCGAVIDRIGPVMQAAVERHEAGAPLEPSQMPPARFSLNGLAVEDDWPNFQLDGYGTWLWALHEHLRRTGARDVPTQLAPVVERTARYLAELGRSPCFDVWEEAGSSVHTTTLACVCGGLRAAAAMLDHAGLAEQAGSLAASLLDRARREGRFSKSDHSRDVDASLLWLCEPFGVVPPSEAVFVETVRAIAEELDLDGGIRRYPGDTYYGGGAWPVLTASLGWYYARTGDLDAAERCREWVAGHFDDEGHLAEQFGGDKRDPAHYSEWVGRWGPPAADLTWSHAMYVVLATEIKERALGPGANHPSGSRPSAEEALHEGL
jgi:GH15 family glucan-1,4-alpha-glucosidase